MGGVAVSKTVDETLDEFRGQGGSYVIDPATGQRTLVERTAETAPAADEPVNEENDDAAA